MNFTEPQLIVRFAAVDATDSGHFQGLASTPDMDRHGDQVAKGAFADSVAALCAGRQRVPLLLDHDVRKQIGAVVTAVETGMGLLISGRIVPGSTEADRALALARADGVGLSVGFTETEGGTDSLPSGGKIYRKVDWVETSVVATPSNRQSRFLTIRSAVDSGPAELAALLRTGELPPMPRRLAERIARGIHELLEHDDEREAAEIATLAAALDSLRQSFKP